HHESPCLDQILHSILNERNCTIRYCKDNEIQSVQVQFFKISAKFAQWYAAGIDLKTNQYRVFRCDRIIDVTQQSCEPSFSIDELIDRSIEIYRSDHRVDFEVDIEEKGKDLFYKEHYPSMKLKEGSRNVITGFYNPGEEAFIADYFMRFGKYV